MTTALLLRAPNTPQAARKRAGAISHLSSIHTTELRTTVSKPRQPCEVALLQPAISKKPLNATVILIIQAYTGPEGEARAGVRP